MPNCRGLGDSTGWQQVEDPTNAGFRCRREGVLRLKSRQQKQSLAFARLRSGGRLPFRIHRSSGVVVSVVMLDVGWRNDGCPVRSVSLHNTAVLVEFPVDDPPCAKGNT